MYWKRLSHTFLLGMGFSVLGVGCAAVDALVSSPAGHSANSSSPERLTAIGRVFENQGHYAKATAMYRGALRSDPSNAVAKERLETIAMLKQQRTFNAAEQRTRQAIAAADALNPARTKSTTHQQPTVAPPEVPEVPTKIEDALNSDSVIASLTPADSVPNVADPEAVESQSSAGETLPVISSEADGEQSDSGWELAGLEDVDQPSQSWEDNEGTAAVVSINIEPIGYEADSSAETTVATLATDWTSSSRPVTLDEVTIWMESPVGYRDELIGALQYGEDDGVRALAAAILVECPLGDDHIDSALERASLTGSDLLKVTALDALIQRGHLTSDSVDRLLSSLRSEDPAIQAQVAASLRNLAQTSWADQCVRGLADLITDDDPTVVAAAAATLGDFGRQAAGCRILLSELVTGQSDAAVTEAAQLALSRIPDDSQTPTGGAIDLPPASAFDNGDQAGVYLPVAE